MGLCMESQQDSGGEVGEEPSVAILMDFENARDADLHRILAEAAAFGRVIVRRAYADWTRYAHARDELREAGFEEIHQFSSGHHSKNATDINLTVDAMDILYTRPVDVFLLVTADSDFAKLARRLREGGKRVVGVGAKARVGRALVQSCDQYIYYDTDARVVQVPREPGEHPDKDRVGKERVEITDLHRIVLEAMPAAADDNGRVYGGPLAQSIRRIRPDFTYQDHGHNSFLRCIESLEPMIKTEHDPDASDFQVWVDPAYEELAAEIRKEQRGESSPTLPVPEDDEEGDVTLAKDVQKEIHKEWTQMANDGKLQGSKAAGVISDAYGVSRLGETPLGNLEGVLEAAPLLRKHWDRDGAVLHKK